MGLLLNTKLRKPKVYFFCLSWFLVGFVFASWMQFNPISDLQQNCDVILSQQQDIRSIVKKNKTTIRNKHQNRKNEASKEALQFKRLAGKMDAIRVLCWIMTSPLTLTSRAIHVRDTWGKRCDVTLFMSTESNATFPAIGLLVNEGYDFVWSKTREAFRYIYKNHFNNADWFLKADDDTYVIIENLRYFLSDKNKSDPVFYGHNFEYNNIEYMSGGAGYVLSREALKRFIGVMDDEYMCTVNATKRSEDLEMGRCLRNAGVKAGDSRDDMNRTRFFPFRLTTFLNKGNLALVGWFTRYSVYKQTEGEDCCSDYVISIHYVDPNAMHYLEFIVYHLRVAQPNKKLRID